MITVQGYLTQHAPEGAAPAGVVANAEILIPRVNAALSLAWSSAVPCCEAPQLASGWRPPAFNATVPNAAVNSKHMTGQAVDIVDPDGDLDAWCMANIDTLTDMGLWLEHPSSTKGWCHLQSIPPRSGNNPFYP